MGINTQVRFTQFFLSLIMIIIVFLLVLSAKADLLGFQNTSELGSNGCNWYRGEWVYDPSSNPPYESWSCPFIDPVYDCQKFGRPDKLYLKYRWKPTSCDLPRFDGLEFLRRWQGKKIMFVGDSIGRDQWNSLVCMLHAAVPNARITYAINTLDPYVTFQDYGLTLYSKWAPYLVDLVQESRGRVLKLDSIEQGKAWVGMDLLIFDTWHWWTFTGTFDYVEDGSTITKDTNRLIAFYKGLTTWGRWIDQNVDPSKTRVLFQGITTDHYAGRDWGSKSNCEREQEPIKGSSYPKGRPEATIILKRVLSRLKNPVQVLDITTMSQLRKDAHPSKYNPNPNYMDCTHWCLPGLPDTWNHLLYAALI